MCRGSPNADDNVRAAGRRTLGAALIADRQGFTEYRPDNDVHFDRTQVALGAAKVSDCAMTVLATIVSQPAPDRIILDSGSTTLTNDGARGFLPTPGVGEVLDHPNLLVERLSNHSCVVSHLVDHAWLIDGHEPTALEMAGRGRIT